MLLKYWPNCQFGTKIQKLQRRILASEKGRKENLAFVNPTERLWDEEFRGWIFQVSADHWITDLTDVKGTMDLVPGTRITGQNYRVEIYTNIPDVFMVRTP